MWTDTELAYLAGIIDGEGKRIFKKKLPNDPLLINNILKPFKEEIVGIVVESTYNWYWLVDALMEEGHKVHLANPAAIQQYSGLKHADDKHDACHRAEAAVSQFQEVFPVQTPCETEGPVSEECGNKQRGYRVAEK